MAVSQNGMTCDYCGEKRQQVIFAIGATLKGNPTADWCMHEGSGKISCPNCHERGLAEGQARIKAHIEAFNA